MAWETSYGKNGRVVLQMRYGSAGISEKHLCSWEHMLLVAVVSGHAVALNDNEIPQGSARNGA